MNTTIDDLLSSKICERLIDYGINYNSLNYYQETPYECCIQNNSHNSKNKNKLLKGILRKQLIHDLNKDLRF